MKKNKEKRVRKPLKDLTLLDRFLFDTAMSVPEFLHFVEETPDDDKEIKNERVRELADQIDHLKSSQGVGVRYMRLWEEMEELKQEAITEGKELGIEMGREEGRAQGCA